MLSFRTALWGAWAIGLSAVAAASCGINDSATSVTGGGGSGGAASSTSTNPDVTSPTSTTTVSTSTQSPTSSTTSTQVGTGGGNIGGGDLGGADVGGGNVGAGGSTASAGGGATTGTGGSGGATVTTTTTTTGTGGGSPTCGDGLIEGSEQCDGDGQAAGDCHLDCTLRGDPSTCGIGVPQINMNVGMTVAIAGDTTTSTNNDVMPNGGNSCGGDSGNDVKYLVNLTGGGMFSATLTPNILSGWGADLGNPVLDVIGVCPSNPNNPPCCNGTCTLQHTYNASASFFVVVDGNNSSHGPFTLTLTYN